MVFYVHTGSGKLSWTDGGREMEKVDLTKGDVYRLHSGSLFFLQSNSETEEREKLRIHAIFTNVDENVYDPSIGAYSRIADLVLGFDRKILKSGFKAPEDVIDELTSAMKQPAIVHAEPVKKSIFWQLESRFLKAIASGSDRNVFCVNDHDKKKAKTKSKTINLMDADPDFKNCNGWSVTVNLKSLKGSNFGAFMVNLKKGSMMGPHWNPMATEIAVVLQGQGMIQAVCSAGRNKNESECKNMRFRVKEGDTFVIPRLHSMAQMSFNNDSFVFMGFSTATKKNYPQFLVGKRSVFQTMDKHMLGLSFNVSNTTIERLLASQEESIILKCTSCAEEEERITQEQIQKEKEDDSRKKEEKEEEGAERKRQEEEAKRKEEAAKRQEEERERKTLEEEEKARRREEEEKQKERQKREDETKREERRKWEEEERKRREEAAKKQQEEAEKLAEERERRQREEKEISRKVKREKKKREEKEKQRKQKRNVAAGKEYHIWQKFLEKFKTRS